MLDAAARISWNRLARAQQLVTVQVQGPRYHPAVTVNGLPLPHDACPPDCWDADALRQAVVAYLDSLIAGSDHSGWTIQVTSAADQSGS